MKRAKFALTAVAVLAVIGGALAFKANRTTNLFYTDGTTTRGGVEITGCVVSTDLFLKTTIPQAGFQTTLSSTFLANTPCPTTRVIENL